MPRNSPKTVADYLIAAGHPAGQSISMWQRHGSVYGNVKTSQPSQDPYEVRVYGTAGVCQDEALGGASGHVGCY